MVAQTNFTKLALKWPKQPKEYWIRNILDEFKRTTHSVIKPCMILQEATRRLLLRSRTPVALQSPR